MKRNMHLATVGLLAALASVPSAMAASPVAPVYDERKIQAAQVRCFADAATCERNAGYGEHGLILRDACVAGVAMARREMALCLQIKPSGIRDTCHMMCMLRLVRIPIDARTSQTARSAASALSARQHASKAVCAPTNSD